MASSSSREAEGHPHLVAVNGDPEPTTEGAEVLSLDLQSLDYGGAPVLGGLHLTVRRGETVALTGPSGIGKSSLLRVIAGLQDNYHGVMKVTDRIAVVFQEPTLLPWRTAAQNLCLTTGCSRAESDRAMAEVGLGGMGERYPDTLSLGQQRRLSLARAFAAKPDLLLMDEPFVSLDPELADEMMRLFAALRTQYRVATILVTHVETEAERLATRILKLGGAPATVIDERQNKGAYLQLSASGVTSSKS